MFLFARAFSITLMAACFCIFAKAATNTTPLTLPNANTTNTINTPAPPSLDLASYALMDAASGKVLASKNGEAHLPPASLTKIMTMYVVSDALKRGQIHLDDKVRISEKAWKTGGSRMFVKVGDLVNVSDLIKGVIITSGNDACVALAEHIAGSEDAFADLMNQHAKRLGMKNSHFTDSTGMPADNHYTSAEDMAILANALINDFPDYYPWYKEKKFIYNNIEQYNRNRLLWNDPEVDGVKTGHTDAAGYCLVASKKKENMRLISVVFNAKTNAQRAEDSDRLLTYGFSFFTSQLMYKAQDPLGKSRIWFGEKKEIPVGVAQDLYVTLPKQQYNQLKATLEISKTLQAPITKGQPIGKVNVTLAGNTVMTVPVVALETVNKAGFFKRMIEHISFLFHSWLDDDSINLK